MFYNICPDGLDESIATNGFWSEIILMLLNTDSKIRTLRWEIVVPRSKDFAVQQNQERILFIGKELRSFLAFWAVGFKLYFKSQFTVAIYFTLWLDMHFSIVTWYSLSLLHVQFCLNFSSAFRDNSIKFCVPYSQDHYLLCFSEWQVSSWIFVLFSFMRSVSTNINIMMGIGKWKNIENNSLILVNLPDTEINELGKQMVSIFHVPVSIQLLLFSLQIFHKDWPFGIRHSRPLLELVT